MVIEDRGARSPRPRVWPFELFRIAARPNLSPRNPVSKTPGPLQPLIGEIITSRRARSLRRHLRRGLEWASGRDGTVEWFHDAGDPRAGLLAIVLRDVRERFDIDIQPFTVSGIDAPFRPSEEQFASYAHHDARMLAEFHGLPEPTHRPRRTQADRANAELHELENDVEAYIERAIALHHELFHSEHPNLTDRTSAGPKQNRRLLHKRGHYLAGTMRYHGEWFWGIDRLPLLEQVFRRERRGNGSSLFTYPEKVSAWRGDTLECFFSFRSPYSYIALPRVFDIADRYQLHLKLRPILPMVSRGISLPASKERYILLDAAREAYRHNIVFGRIRDPFGKGVENAIAVFASLDEDYQRQFAWCAMNAAWARGVNLANRKELANVGLEAGLDAWQVDEALSEDAWRELAEQNRRDLTSLGLWGVPSFRLGEHHAWGQDRLPILRAGVARARTAPGK